MSSGFEKIGEILVRLGHAHAEQIDEALELQKIRPKRLGELLLDIGYNEEDHILRALSEQFGIAYWPDLKPEDVDATLTTRVPINFIREYRMVPAKESGGAYVVALNDPVNLLPLDELRMLLGGPVDPVLCKDETIQFVIDTYFDRQGENAQGMIDDITMAHDDDNIPSLDRLDSDRDLLDLANEAPIIKLINLMISGAVKERASDIHIEPFERDVRIRYRIDGVLYEKFDVPKNQQAAVISRIKIMANLNIAEHRLPQDGRIKIRLTGKEIDIRVSVIPVSWGERVVMRILEKGSFIYGLEELGMGKRDFAVMGKLIQSSHGIILVTGPTGSGKSTTLYSALQRVNSPDKNIITVEDPIEYQMPGIGQIEVKPKIGLTFAAGLRSILRQDPDVILIGEIRDHETAEMAIQASLTGHLVFATLHTNDSAGAITRLINMGIEPFLVTSSTVAILAQRLVRSICKHCKEDYEPDWESIRELGIDREDMMGIRVSHGLGCEKCMTRGYYGRLGIFEMLTLTPSVQDLALRGADSNVIKKEARKQGMRTLREDGAEKVLEGKTTVEEVLRVTRDELVEELVD